MHKAILLVEDNADDGHFAFTVGVGFNIGGR